VLLGTVVRRSLAATALTLVGFIAVRGPIEFILRLPYMTPVTVTAAPGASVRWCAWRPSSSGCGGAPDTAASRLAGPARGSGHLAG
jgi:hypothetical protein